MNEALVNTRKKLLNILMSDEIKLSEIDRAVKLMKHFGCKNEIKVIGFFFKTYYIFKN